MEVIVSNFNLTKSPFFGKNAYKKIFLGKPRFINFRKNSWLVYIVNFIVIGSSSVYVWFASYKSMQELTSEFFIGCGFNPRPPMPAIFKPWIAKKSTRLPQ